MGIPHSVTKVLAAAAANNVAASQSPGAGAILINGSASNRISTTTTAATAAGLGLASTILALTTVTGVVVGSTITDSTAAVIPAGTTVVGVDTANSKVILSQPVGGAGVGSGDTIVIGGVATLDTARRIIVTSGGVDTGITFTIFGTAQNGTPIQETVTGASGGASAQTNQDFLTVTAVTHTGSVAGTVTVGTNGVGSTPWFPLNTHAQPFNVELAGIVLAGVTVNWTWQYTYDDPNSQPGSATFPQAFNHPTLNNQTVTLDGSINDPVAAIRLVVNSGTGSVRGDWIEAGISGQ
jgi:hypothetical protein